MSEAWGIPPSALALAHFHPPLDIEASNEFAKLCVDLAGVPEDQITVEVSGKRVRVAGHRPLPDPARRPIGVGYVRAEILYGAFERSVELPWEGDPSKVEVRYRDGLLIVDVRRWSGSRG